MHFFGTHNNHRDSPTRSRHHLFGAKDSDRVAGGYKAALSNPHTTKEGRQHAKHELHMMGRSSHVPLMTKIKRALGIRSTPRRDHLQSRSHERSHARTHRRRGIF